MRIQVRWIKVKTWRVASLVNLQAALKRYFVKHNADSSHSPGPGAGKAPVR